MAATDVTEGAAYMKAGFDLSDLDKDLASYNKKIEAATDKAAAAGKKVDQAFGGKQLFNYKTALESLTGTINDNEKYLAELVNEQNAHSASLKKGETVTAAYIAKEAQLGNEIKHITKVLQLQRAEQTAGVGSIDALKSRIDLLTISYKQLSSVEKSGVLGKAMQKEIGNTTVVLDKAKKELKETGDASEGLGKKLSGGASKAFGFLRNLAYLIPGLGLAGLIGMLIDPLMNFISGLMKGSDAVQRLKKEMEDLKAANQSANVTAGEQIGKLTTLNNVLQSNTASAKAKKGAYDQILKMYPSYQAELEKEYIRTGNVANVINNQLVPAIIAAAKARAYQSRVDALSSKNLDLQDEQLQKSREINEAERKLIAERRKAANEERGSRSDVADDRAAFSAVGAAQSAVKKLKDEWKGLYTQQQANTKQIEVYADAVTKNQPKLGNLTSDGIDAGTYAAKEKKKKDDKEAIKLAEKQAELRAEIAQSEKDLTRKIEDEGGKQAAAIHTKYDKMIADAKKYKLSLEELAKIETLRTREVDDILYTQDTKKIVDALNQRKDLYKDYEDFKLKVGKEAADQVYKDQIDTSKSFVEDLQAELAPLISKALSGTLTNAEAERFKQLSEIGNKNGRDTSKREAKWLENALIEYQSYQQQRLTITKKYDEELKKVQDSGNQQMVAGIENARQNALAKVDRENLETIASTRRMFDDITLITTEAVKNQIESIEYLLQNTTLTPEQRSYLTDKLKGTKGLLGLNQRDRELKQISEAIKQTEKDLADAEKQGIKTGAVIADIQKRLNELKANKASIELDTFKRKLQQLTELGSSVSELGQSIQELAGEGSSLGRLGSALSGIGSQIGNLAKTFETLKTQGATSFDAITAAAQFVIQTINMIISSAAQRRAAEKQYENDRLSFQYAMIDATLEEFKIRQEIQRLTFSTDWGQDMKDAIALRNESLKAYQDAFKDIDKIQAKLGQRNKVDWGKAASSALTGAAAGAVIGSVVPVIGTVIGAVVGGIVGLVSGIFGGKKKKDVWGGVMQEWPELVMKTADGTKVLNVELAKQLIANNLIDDKGKVILQNIINQAEEYKKAYEEISKIVDDVIVDLGDKLRSSLVEAFKAGEDAANVFKRTVSDIIEELISQAAYAAIFEPLVENLQKEMKDSYAIGGDMNWIDDLMRFMDGAEGAAQGFYDLLEAARNEGKSRGLDLFAPSDSAKGKGGLTGAIQSITQEQAGLLVGQFSGMRVAQLQTNTILVNGFSTFNDIADRSLNTLAKIEVNTYNTVLRLDSTVTELKTLNTKIKSADNANRAIGL